MFSMLRNLTKLVIKPKSIAKSTIPQTALKNNCNIFTSAVHKENVFEHIETPQNNSKIPFEFTPENQLRVEDILKMYPKKRAALMPLLDLAQRQHGWLSISAIIKVADIIGVEHKHVYDVSLYYSSLKHKPTGKYHIQVCVSLPCKLRGSEKIWDVISTELGIKKGETTKDRQFSLSRKMCLGACVNAPVIAVNDDFYEDVSICHVKDIIRDCFCDKYSPHGPLRNRTCCEPKGSLSSLTEKPPGPGFGMQECLIKC